MTTSTANKKHKLDGILGPTDPAIDREAREKLITARIGLLLRAPFFGNLATRLKIVNADEWLVTAATDGRSFYYNSRFVNMLSTKELEFLFGHEVLHVAYDHMGRRLSRDPQLYNIACDYAVNADLKKHNIGTMITTVDCLYDKKYEGMSSEEIYDILYENAEKIDINDLLDQLLDDHMDGDDGEDGEGEGKSGKRPRPLTAEEKQQIRDEFREAVIAAAQQSGGAGGVPAGIARMIKLLTEPKMDWRELLRMNLESTIKSDYTWMKSSRRAWHLDAIMPGMRNQEMIDIVVALDTSGSMTNEMLRDFLSEIKGIMEQFEAYRLHLLTFDTQVYNPVTFTSDNLESIEDYEPGGGGGTLFECVPEYLKDNNITPERLVYFTDGYPCQTWGEENICDQLFVIHGNTNIVAPWGTTAYYED